jgi:hypothetical protein
VTPDPNDALLEQLTQAGLYPQQLAQLQRQYQLAQGFMQPQEAQGRQVGGTYVAASPWEHLANAIRPVVGALMQRSAQNREQELTGQLSSGRQAFARALQDKMGKPGEFMPGGAGDQQGLQQLSMLGELSGDPAMQHAAGMYMQQQNQARQLAVLENSVRHQQEMENQGRGRLGISQERVDQMNQQLAMRGIRYDPNLNKFIDIRQMAGVKPPPPRSALPLSTGAAPAAPPGQPPSGDGGGPPPVAPGATGDAPIGKWQDKALKELGADFNPSSGRSGEFGKNQARLNAAQRLLTLAVDPKTGGPADLTPQQMSEISGSLATLIGGGSSGEGTRRELTPYTKGRSIAEIQQWLTDAPHGADQQAFVKQMIDTAKREQGVAQQSIDQVRGQLVSKHQRILRSNPEEARKVLQGFGWDLGPDGSPIMQQAKPPAAVGGDAAALRKKYGL